MNDSLSLAAAARQVPKKIALITENGSYTYEELAELSMAVHVPSPNIRRAPATLNTILSLYSSLDQGRCLALLSANSNEGEVNAASQRFLQRNTDGEALVLFTSGSSGLPKGVILSRAALLASAHAVFAAIPFATGDRWLCCLPLSHMGGLAIILRALVARSTVVLCPKFHAPSVAKMASQHRITHVSLVPTMLWRLLEHGETSPTSLRTTLIGGAPLTSELWTRAQMAGFAICTSYGMTETGSMVICNGRALPGLDFRTGDTQHLEIRGPMLMSGYLPPHDTQEPGDGTWFRTADRASIGTNGEIKIHGRVDDVIISGGENIDLLAIEEEIRKHPLVEACIALGVEDVEWGQRLIVLLVCDGDPRDIQMKTLRGFRRPKSLIPVEKIPLLETGKPDRLEAQKISERYFTGRSGNPAL